MFCNVITLAGINLFLMVLFYNLEEYIAFVVYYQMFFTIPPSQRMLGGGIGIVMLLIQGVMVCCGFQLVIYLD